MRNKADTLLYYPCLMQRLKDEDPKNKKEAISQQKNDFNTIRKIILHNIIDIINAQSLEESLDKQRYPYLFDSVINYGIPPHLGDDNLINNNQNYETQLRKSIIRFEPRLIPESVRVKNTTNTIERGVFLSFELEALVFWLPEPQDISLKLTYDKQLNHFDFL